MLTQENFRKIAITEEQLVSLNNAYNEAIKREQLSVTEQNVTKEIPSVQETKEEVLTQGGVALAETEVNPFTQNSGSTNIFDIAPDNIAQEPDIFSEQPITQAIEEPKVEISSEPSNITENSVETLTNETSQDLVENSTRVLEQSSEIKEPTTKEENIDDILKDINKMQEEFADLNARMIGFGNNIDALLERIKIYLNNKTLNNAKEVASATPAETQNIFETTKESVIPQEPQTPTFDNQNFDMGVNIFDQPSSFVR